jgi:hypothetical protein
VAKTDGDAAQQRCTGTPAAGRDGEELKMPGLRIVIEPDDGRTFTDEQASEITIRLVKAGLMYDEDFTAIYGKDWTITSIQITSLRGILTLAWMAAKDPMGWGL